MKPRRAIPLSVRYEVLRRQADAEAVAAIENAGGALKLRYVKVLAIAKCRMTGEALIAGRTEFDHILPVDLGGSNDADNLQALTAAAHRRKTDADIARIAKANRSRKKIHPIKAGDRFGMLTIIERTKNEGFHRSFLCRCDCGALATERASRLTTGYRQSCGCLKGGKARHGHTSGGINSPTYKSWSSMVERCRNHKSPSYSSYGGAGVSICPRWYTFENFLEDMGPRPAGTTLDRIDGAGNYEASNCRWATPFQQNNNLKSNVLMTFNGRTRTLPEWARELGLDQKLIRSRLRRGLSDEDALTLPHRSPKGYYSKGQQARRAKNGSRLKSRGFDKTLRKKFNGEVERK